MGETFHGFTLREGLGGGPVATYFCSIEHCYQSQTALLST